MYSIKWFFLLLQSLSQTLNIENNKSLILSVYIRDMLCLSSLRNKPAIFAK